MVLTGDGVGELVADSILQAHLMRGRALRVQTGDRGSAV